MSLCTLCPRKCNIDRDSGKRGYCNSPGSFSVAKIMLHEWEEPCLIAPLTEKNINAAGTIFFSGCNLGCIYCQNRKISRGGGKELAEAELEKEIFALIEKGASCIEFVTPTHFSDALASLLSRIKQDIPMPLVYNSGGYESVEALHRFDGLIDIYMPDFKYFSPMLGKKYSNAPDYSTIALAALKEMIRQTGSPNFYENAPEKLKSGIIMRHLILPSHRNDSIEVLKLVASELGVGNVILSLMGQYTPDFYLEYERENGKSEENKNLRRRLTSFEYNSVLVTAERLGFRGYMQDISSASSKFTPKF